METFLSDFEGQNYEERGRKYGKGRGEWQELGEREEGEKLFYSRGKRSFSKILWKLTYYNGKCLKFHEIKFELEEKENWYKGR